MNSYRFSIGVPSVLSLVLLSACGSTVNSPNATYNDFDVVDPVTSQLSGKSFNGTDIENIGPTNVGDVTGTLQHDTRATTINAVGGLLSDANGADQNGELVGDNNTASFSVTGTLGDNRYSGTYSSVRPFDVYAGGMGFGSGSGGFIGMATDPSDMPSAGTATFTGEAVGSTSATDEWVGAPATVTAYFDNARVDVTTQNTANGITESISVNNMTISGNELSGGTLSATHNGVVVDASSFGARAEGQFYGYDPSTGGPDEVGVLISNVGVDSRGDLTILAD